MDSASCSLEELPDAVLALVDDYVGEVSEHLEEDVRASAETGRSAIAAASPSRGRGGYASGWMSEPDAEDAAGKAYRIYNKRKPGLTHLLEKGHGGPHPAGAHPHIAAGAQAGFDELERRLSG